MLAAALAFRGAKIHHSRAWGDNCGRRPAKLFAPSGEPATDHDDARPVAARPGARTAQRLTEAIWAVLDAQSLTVTVEAT